MAESNASVGQGALEIRSPLPTGQTMRWFRDPLSMSEPSRNYVSQIHFDVEAPGMSGGVDSVGGLAEAECTQVPTDRRVSIVAPDDSTANSRGGLQPRAQSTGFPLSSFRNHNTSGSRDNSMDLTDITHISNSYRPNSRSGTSMVHGRRNDELDRSSFLQVPTVSECKIGVSSISSSSTTVSSAASLPSVPAPSLNEDRREPTESLVPVSESERLLCPGVVQPKSVQCSSRSDVVNSLNWQNNSVSSSHSLPGFSSTSQPEIRDVPVYSHSHMPSREINPTLSHVPLPTANFSSGPYMSSTSYHQVPGYFPQYASLLQPNTVYPAPIQHNVGTSVPFSHVAQGSYSLPPTAPPTYGLSYQPNAPANIVPLRPPAQGRFNVSVPGHLSNFSAFERSSFTREKRTTELFVKWHITFKGDRKRDPEGFLANLTRFKETYELNLDEII